uniref:Reverse transcriptase zinc-binding domain-containing protein n=1 Tax=Arundo donax TaxID=35708 RepID=A0A0A9AWH4_ARUDO
MQIPTIQGNGSDILCWKPTSTGVCTAQSAYKTLALEAAAITPPSNIPVQVIQLLRIVWADKIIQPRLKTFAWRLLRLALGTASRVHRIIPTIDEMLPLRLHENRGTPIFQLQLLQGSLVSLQPGTTRGCYSIPWSWPPSSDRNHPAPTATTSNNRFHPLRHVVPVEGAQ